ncbi:MAG: hypothetical protein J7513_05165 [Solirubrobacteraceae bacterium]|nr:hypothetical protein [Solirubrobacteraceae bacterium]
MRLSHRLASGLALAAVAIAPSSALAVENGPAPTSAYLRADSGPYSVTAKAYSDAETGSGFGAATVYAPSNGAAGQKFGVVAFAPGWTESASAVDWLAKRVATFGFVTISFNVNNTFLDFPDSRGKQLLSALDFVTNTSTAKTLADASRQGVSGHSMGGGGTLYASRARKSLKAAVGLAPWSTDTNWSDVVTPSLEIGAQNDFIAPVNGHAKAFYNTLTAPKQYLEMKSFGHLQTNYPSAQVGASTVAWFKRFVDGDARYVSATCPTQLGVQASELSASQSAC